MIVTLNETKEFLKVDYDDEDVLINNLILASEQYLSNATNKVFTSENKLAQLYCKVLISDWYENRSLMEDKKTSNKVRFTLQSILTQLKYGD